MRGRRKREETDTAAGQSVGKRYSKITKCDEWMRENHETQ